MKYTGLMAGLPVPQAGQGLSFSMPDLRLQLDQYLEGEDRDWVHAFFFRIDWTNAEYHLAGNGLWMEGGNLEEGDLDRWFQQSPDVDSLFYADELPSADHERLHVWWETYYTVLRQHADPNLQRLLAFDISLRNFRAGWLWRTLTGGDAEQPAQYLSGGWFDRFAYEQGQLGDIRAEHPYTAAVLACWEEDDPQERQEAMLTAQAAFYDYAAFFDPFGMVGLAARLLAYLEWQRMATQDPGRGKSRLEAYVQQQVAQTETHPA